MMPTGTPGPDAFLVRCKWQPNGDHGLEGFDLGVEYWAEKALDAKGEHMRVWPDDRPRGQAYFETCGQKSFNRCFEPV
jgi:hypothetical protein